MRNIAELNAHFVSTWSPYLGRTPVLALDGRWPSLGVIDLLLSENMMNLAPVERQIELLFWSSAYVGELLSGVLHRAGVRCEVTASAHSVTLTVIREGGPVELHVTELIQKHFTRRLVRQPNELPGAIHPAAPTLLPLIRSLLRGETANVNEGSNELPSGTPAEMPSELILTPAEIRELARIVAHDCAEWYARVHPDDPLGQVSELYLGYARSVLGPERLPDCIWETVTVLVEFLREYGVSERHSLTLLSRLMVVPDEVLSSAALVIYSALGSRNVSPEIAAIGQLRAPQMPALRKLAVAARRELFARGEDPLISAPDPIQLLRRYRFESAMGLVPLIYLDDRALKSMVPNTDFHRAFAALLTADVEGAKQYLDTIIDDDLENWDCRFQRLFLELGYGDTFAVEQELAELADSAAVRQPRYWDLRGACALNRSNFVEAVEAFRRGLPLCGRSPQLQPSLAGKYAWALMNLEDFGRATFMLNIAQRETFDPATVLLDKAICLHQLHHPTDAKKIEKKVFAMAPLDRRVFVIGVILGVSPAAKVSAAPSRELPACA